MDYKEYCCIFLISARKELLKKCLYFLDENYNKSYNHDIIIFYHGNKYDSNELNLISLFHLSSIG